MSRESEISKEIREEMYKTMEQRWETAYWVERENKEKLQAELAKLKGRVIYLLETYRCIGTIPSNIFKELNESVVKDI